jgi:hypothetical protein
MVCHLLVRLKRSSHADYEIFLDTALIAAFYAFPPFAEKYGTYTGEENGYQIPAKWQVCSSPSRYQESKLTNLPRLPSRTGL